MVTQQTGDEHRHEFHESLERLRGEIVRLGAMVGETIPAGTDALLSSDLRLAQQLIDADDEVDVLALDIEERCYQLLALQQPMAGDLRFIVTSLRLVSELERSADLMVNVCKAMRRIYGVEFDPRVRGLIEAMSVEALTLTRHSIDAYVEEDANLAQALDDIDDRLDELQSDYIEAVFESHRVSELTLQGAVQLALIGRYYERIGDHAVNIGERVTYMVTGWLPEHTGAARARLRHGTLPNVVPHASGTAGNGRGPAAAQLPPEPPEPPAAGE